MSEPIRILHMIGSLNVGGSQSMIINLHKAIDKSKVQFDYIIDHPGHLHYASEVTSLGGKIYEFPTFKGYNFLEIRKVWKQFFAKHPEYKILHSHVRSYASLYLPIAKKAGLKTIIHSHSTSNGKGVSSVIKRFMQFPLRWQADYFFGCSKEAGRWLFGDKIVNGSKYYILQNAIDADLYRFNPLIRKEYREQLGLGDKKTFIHVGRFHPAKNHNFLLKVFDEIHRQDSNTKLLLVGDGSLRNVIERQIEMLGLQNDVALLGNRRDVPSLLQSADCLLFPSVWEGFGMVAVEAQAAGLPCICSESVPKSAKVSDNCWFVSTENVSKWVETINQLRILSNRNEILQLDDFDIRNTAKKIEDFYAAI